MAQFSLPIFFALSLSQIKEDLVNNDICDAFHRRYVCTGDSWCKIWMGSGQRKRVWIALDVLLDVNLSQEFGSTNQDLWESSGKKITKPSKNNKWTNLSRPKKIYENAIPARLLLSADKKVWPFPLSSSQDQIKINAYGYERSEIKLSVNNLWKKKKKSSGNFRKTNDINDDKKNTKTMTR